MSLSNSQKSAVLVSAPLHKLLLILIALTLGACAMLAAREYLIPKDQIVSTLQEHFPQRIEAGVSTHGVKIGVTQLNLIPDQNRVSVEGDFVANAGKLELIGHFVYSSTLRYDSEQFAVFLADGRLDSLQFRRGRDFPVFARSLVDRVVTASMMKHPVYRFRPSQLVVLGTEIEVGAIDVVQDGILLKFRKVTLRGSQ